MAIQIEGFKYYVFMQTAFLDEFVFTYPSKNCSLFFIQLCLKVNNGVQNAVGGEIEAIFEKHDFRWDARRTRWMEYVEPWMSSLVPTVTSHSSIVFATCTFRIFDYTYYVSMLGGITIKSRIALKSMANGILITAPPLKIVLWRRYRKNLLGDEFQSVKSSWYRLRNDTVLHCNRSNPRQEVRKTQISKIIQSRWFCRSAGDPRKRLARLPYARLKPNFAIKRIKLERKNVSYVS